MRSDVLISLTTSLLAFTAVACAGAADRADVELPSPEAIRGDTLHQVLPPDAIPAVDEPRFVPAGEADFMADDEPVVGVVLNGEAKAYSLWHLDHHEIVNDRFGKDPVAVTW